jgi:hypothetical protein
VELLIHQGFDLAHGPVLKAYLCKVGADYLFLLNIHHIATDLWSMRIIARELVQFYQAQREGQPLQLPPLAIQYVDYAQWQRAYLETSGSVYQKQLRYWEEQLADIPPLLVLPFDKPRPAIQSNAGERIEFFFSKAISERLKQLSSQQEATLFMTMLSAFYDLLYRYTQQADIVIGTPIANRTRKEIENLIGFFVNTLALRARIKGDMSFESLLQQIKRTTLEAYDHQDLPFEHLVDELKVERSLSHSPVFQVMFVLQNAAEENQLVESLPMVVESFDYRLSKFDLLLK